MLDGKSLTDNQKPILSAQTKLKRDLGQAAACFFLFLPA
jgi:hypothetical protein